MAKNETSQHNHDAIYGIVRDVSDKNLTVEDAVAKLKGLDDNTQLTNESFEEADNVKKNKEDEPEFPSAEPNAVDPGEGADFDINDTVGVDPTDDTTTLRVVPDDQLVSKTSEIEDGVLVAKETEEDEPEASVEDADAAEEDKRPINRRKQKKLDAKEATKENDAS